MAALSGAATQATQAHITTARYEYLNERLADSPILRARLAQMRIETDRGRRGESHAPHDGLHTVCAERHRVLACRQEGGEEIAGRRRRRLPDPLQTRRLEANRDPRKPLAALGRDLARKRGGWKGLSFDDRGATRKPREEQESENRSR